MDCGEFWKELGMDITRSGEEVQFHFSSGKSIRVWISDSDGEDEIYICSGDGKPISVSFNPRNLKSKNLNRNDRTSIYIGV